MTNLEQKGGESECYMEKIGITPSTTRRLLTLTLPVPNVEHLTSSCISLDVMAVFRNSGVPYAEGNSHLTSH
jgi:hypothetical protein